MGVLVDTLATPIDSPMQLMVPVASKTPAASSTINDTLTDMPLQLPGHIEMPFIVGILMCIRTMLDNSDCTLASTSSPSEASSTTWIV